jgi:NO-binding membrane sensor protein with MHYT domain
VFNVLLIGATVFVLLSLSAPPLPYGYLWEIFFAAILAVSLVLAIKYQSFGKRWSFLLFVVGVAEFEFSGHVSPPYNTLVVGVLIGLATAYSGIVIPVSYWAKQHFRKKKVKIFFVLSGFVELIAGLVGVFYSSNFYLGFDPQTIWFVVFGLVTIGIYSLIVGIASLFYTKPKSSKTIAMV